jgi:multiple antibiotic resistance protein
VLLTLITSAVATFAALFPIVNPIGGAAVFYGLTATESPSFRHSQAERIAIYAVAILIVSLLAGRLVLQFFGISLGVLQIAGGLVVAHTGWEMVALRERLTREESAEAKDSADVSFTPMALPVISGPGAIGVVIAQGSRTSAWPEQIGHFVGIAMIGAVVYLCLVLGEPLIRRMGSTGVGALTRIFGFLILAIAVQLIADGVLALVHENATALPAGVGP